MPRTAAVVIALFVAALLPYLQTAGHEFVTFDDEDYLSKNLQVQAGLTGDSIAWAMTTGHASNWHPLTWWSHMLDVEMFGMDPGLHHLMNAVLHGLNAVLLLLGLRLMTGALWPSALAAALFALHPMRAESVAWASERKDVLSTTFWLLAMLGYARYVARPSMLRYAGVFFAMAIGLMAKPMLVTLPAVLLLLDIWPLRRWHLLKPAEGTAPDAVPFGRLALEKVPLLGLTLASAVTTTAVQSSGGAVSGLDGLSLGERSTNAIISYVQYLWQTIYPFELACFYPHPALIYPDDSRFVTAATCLAVLAGVTWWLVRNARSAPYGLIGWLWYLGTLVPVIGILQVGQQSHADRYTYVPMIGVYFAVAFAVAKLAKRRQQAVAIAASVVLVAFTAMSFVQASHWENTSTLFEHTRSVTDKNYAAETNLGVYRAAAFRESRGKSRADFEAAQAHYLKAIEYRPGHQFAYLNLGQLMLDTGQLDESIRYCEKALEITPTLAKAAFGIGMAQYRQGKIADSIKSFRRALTIDPGYPDAQNNLAWMLSTTRNAALRNGKEAVNLATSASSSTNHRKPLYLRTLAAAHAEAGDFQAAVKWQRQAMALVSADQRARDQKVLQAYESRRPFRDRR